MQATDGIILRLPRVPALRERLLRIPKVPGEPLYVYDAEETRANVRAFREAFAAEGLPVRICYAIKSNCYAGLLKTVADDGEHLDASSRRELALALQAGARGIVYTGPAKTEGDFADILRHHERITVNLESERELRLLSRMAAEQGVKVRCGLRVHTGGQRGWTKFGLPLAELAPFFRMARSLPGIDFCGIHFHISMNKTPERYVQTLTELATYAEDRFSPEERAAFRYLDMGGGFFPQSFEGVYAWNPEQKMGYFSGEDHLEAIFADRFRPRYTPVLAEPIGSFARSIAGVFRERLSPALPEIGLFAEPGRYVCHSAMHLLLTLVDLKDPQKGIADGGNNMVGWEKHQFFNYTPLFNLTHFSMEREIPFLLYGSLCTPDDVWGYYLYCADAAEGDTICMPYQGAYTYTLAQEFIREIPAVVDIQ